MRFLKHSLVLGAALLSSALWANPAEKLAPMVPADADILFGLSIAQIEKMPFVQEAMTKKPEEKAKFDAALAKYKVRLADFKKIEGFGNSAAQTFALLISTSVKPETLLQMIMDIDSTIQKSEQTLKGLKVYILKKDKGAAQTAGMDLNVEEGVLCSPKAGMVLISDRKGFEWAVKPSATLSPKAPVVKAVLQKADGMPLWFSYASAAPKESNPSTPNPMAMGFDPASLKAVAGGFFSQGETFTAQIRLICKDADAATQMAGTVQMMVGMMTMQMAQKNPGLVKDLTSALKVKAVKDNVGITFKFTSALLEKLQALQAAQMGPASMGGNEPEIDIELEEEETIQN